MWRTSLGGACSDWHVLIPTFATTSAASKSCTHHQELQINILDSLALGPDAVATHGAAINIFSKHRHTNEVLVLLAELYNLINIFYWE